MINKNLLPFGEGIPGFTLIPKTEAPWNEEEVKDDETQR